MKNAGNTHQQLGKDEIEIFVSLPLWGNVSKCGEDLKEGEYYRGSNSDFERQNKEEDKGIGLLVNKEEGFCQVFYKFITGGVCASDAWKKYQKVVKLPYYTNLIRSSLKYAGVGSNKLDLMLRKPFL